MLNTWSVMLGKTLTAILVMCNAFQVMCATIAVSYTHLDVYKRQEEPLDIVKKQEKPKMLITEERRKKNNRNQTTN